MIILAQLVVEGHALGGTLKVTVTDSCCITLLRLTGLSGPTTRRTEGEATPAQLSLVGSQNEENSSVVEDEYIRESEFRFKSVAEYQMGYVVHFTFYVQCILPV